MKILFIADGRSPTALNWINNLVTHGDEVHLVSIFDCHPGLDLVSLNIIRVALSGAVGSGGKQGESANSSFPRNVLRKLATPSLRTALRHWLVPPSLPHAAKELGSLVEKIEPDLVHAMRIPYEGMLAALALDGFPQIPLVVSVWGNDFTLHAPSTRRMKQLTQRCLRRANALLTDCRKDQQLAFVWGFDPSKEVQILPGAGGIQLDIFYPSEENYKDADTSNPFTVVNPRGLRTYVRNDTFFRSIPIILESQPDMHFICSAMKGEFQAENWINKLGISRSVDLKAHIPRSEMAEVFRQSQLAVSPSIHDGTPNTLLESMACGCLPIAGDIESIREWITPGVNGLLFDPNDPADLAKCILHAHAQTEFRERAIKHNLKLVVERAEYHSVMKKARDFYRQVINEPRF